MPSTRQGNSFLGIAASSASSAEATDEAPLVTRAGGNWKACAANFLPSGDSRRDVERLGLLCGPVNGMSVVGEAFEGNASNEPSNHAFPVASGVCYRIFGVADASVADLVLRVVSVRGSQLAAEEQPGRVAMLESDRAFCTFATETVTAEVTSKDGTGRYALRIYQLPTHD